MWKQWKNLEQGSMWKPMSDLIDSPSKKQSLNDDYPACIGRERLACLWSGAGPLRLNKSSAQGTRWKNLEPGSMWKPMWKPMSERIDFR